MKFESLIWVVIFLIYVLSIIIKRMRAASKTENKGAHRPDWRKKLDEFLAKARQEMNASTQEGPVQETDWERFLPQEDDAAEPLRDEPPPQKIVKVKEKTPAPKIKPTPVKAAAKSPAPVVSEKKIPSKGLASGTEDLRKAVIWSEILAPPLALRDR